MLTRLSLIILVLFLFISCKGSDMPDTNRDKVDNVPTMEIKDPKVLIKNARFYIEEGQYDTALEALKAAEKNGAKKSETSFLKGRLFLSKKQYDKAIKEFDVAEKKGYSVDEIDLFRGTLFFNKKMPEKALEYFRKSEQKALQSKERISKIGLTLYQNMGLLYQQKKDYRKSIIYFNKAIKFDPSSHENFFYAGLAYYKLDNFNKSIEYLQKTINLKPRMFKAYKYLATAYYTKGQKDKSFYIMAKGFTIKQTYQNTQYAHKELSKIKNIAENKDALELMIFTKISIGLYKAAEKLINIGIKKYPSDYIFPVFLGRMEIKKQNPKKALVYAEKAEKKFGANFEIEILKGNIYINLNNDDKAIEHLEKALYINPQNYTYRYKLADIYRRKKQKNLEYLHQGIYYVLREQYEQAKYPLTRFPENHERSYESNCWLGRIYMEQGVYQTSLEYLNKSIKQKPDYFLPYTFKCFTLFRLGRKAEGLNTLRSFMNKYSNKTGIKEIRKLYNSFSKF